MPHPANQALHGRLGRVHRWVHEQGWLRRFTLMNWLLLAMAFFPTGLVKLLGRRFTAMSPDTPIGGLFEALYQTGPYWHFIGLVQVLAALLLLVPRTATIGALLFAPVAISVFLITLGLDFHGTVYITAGMLLSVVYLICWDVDRIAAAIKPLFARRVERPLLQGMHWLEAIGWLTGGATGMGFFLTIRGLLPHAASGPLVIAGLTAIVTVVAGWIVGAVRPLPTRGVH